MHAAIDANLSRFQPGQFVCEQHLCGGTTHWTVSLEAANRLITRRVTRFLLLGRGFMASECGFNRYVMANHRRMHAALVGHEVRAHCPPVLWHAV